MVQSLSGSFVYLRDTGATRIAVNNLKSKQQTSVIHIHVIYALFSNTQQPMPGQYQTSMPVSVPIPGDQASYHNPHQQGVSSPNLMQPPSAPRTTLSPQPQSQMGRNSVSPQPHMMRTSISPQPQMSRNAISPQPPRPNSTGL